MRNREKRLLCAVAYVLALTAWFTVAAPAVTEAQDRLNELTEKNKEDAELKIKLRDVARLRKEQQSLNSEIDQLRGSVPKSPDIDILMIDMEKMVLASGLDIVSVLEPEREKLKLSEESQETDSLQPVGAPKVSGFVSGKAPPPKPAAPTAPGAKAGAPAPIETGLVKHVLQVTVTGSYAGFIELMKKLEAYQRVIGVNQIDLGFPTEGKEQKEPDSKRLNISFLMTAYYLP